MLAMTVIASACSAASDGGTVSVDATTGMTPTPTPTLVSPAATETATATAIPIDAVDDSLRHSLPISDYEGDLVVTDSRLLDGVHLRLRGNLHVAPSGSLTMQDAVLEIDATHAAEFNGLIEGAVILERTDIVAEQPTTWDIRGDGSITLNDVRKVGTQPWPWMSFGEHSTATVHDSEFDATIFGEAKIQVNRSPSMYMELVFEPGAQADAVLGPDVSSLRLPGPDDDGVAFALDVRDSVARGWGVTTWSGADVTLRGAHNVVSTISIGGPVDNAIVELDGLDNVFYVDRTWEIAGSRLRLIDTQVYEWSVNVYNANAATVRDSFLADLAFSGQQGRLAVQRSRVFYVRAREEVEITLADSIIEGDVVAEGQGRVVLRNTAVRGGLFERDEGRIQVIAD